MPSTPDPSAHPVRPSRTSRRVFAGLGATVALAAGLTACQHDGRTLAPSKPGQTQSVYTPTTTTTIAGASTTSDLTKFPSITSLTTVLPSPLTMQLPFADEGQMATRFTCYGDDVHPQASWFGVPAGTVEMALTVTDADANDFVHWVVAGLDPNTLLTEGAEPVGAIEGLNGFSTATAPSTGWRGPCPPSGTTHHYWFTLYALNKPVTLPTGSSAADMQAAIDAATISTSQVTGIFTAL